MVEAASAEVPSRVGRYEVLGKIATGGMASVHLGRLVGAQGFERLVAIKICHEHLREDEDFASMFFDEARLAARIHHPNVVATLDIGNEPPLLYLVMEFIEGERLSDLVRSDARAGNHMPIPIAARVVTEALRGLHAAHELVDADGQLLKVVHRDVSPQNIMVGVDGVTRIMDFGVARAEARAVVTAEGTVKGKFAYMSPEQALTLEVDRRADVFAAGVVLWEALTGRRLFAADSTADIVQRVLHLPIPPPSELRPEAAPLDDAVMSALEREPDLRAASAEALADAIERAVELAKPSEVREYVRARSGATDRRRALQSVARSGVEPRVEPTSVTQSAVAAAPPPSRGQPWLLGGGVLAVALAVAGWAWSQQVDTAASSRARAAPRPERTADEPTEVSSPESDPPLRIETPPAASVAAPDAGAPAPIVEAEAPPPRTKTRRIPRARPAGDEEEEPTPASGPTEFLPSAL